MLLQNYSRGKPRGLNKLCCGHCESGKLFSWIRPGKEKWCESTSKSSTQNVSVLLSPIIIYLVFTSEQRFSRALWLASILLEYLINQVHCQSKATIWSLPWLVECRIFNFTRKVKYVNTNVFFFNCYMFYIFKERSRKRTNCWEALEKTNSRHP